MANTSQKELVSSGSEFEALIGYSRAVVSGDWIFVSGCTGYDYATGELKEGVADQADQCLKNVAAALADVKDHPLYEKPTVADIVRVRYILPDRNNFSKTWPVLQKWFGGPQGAMPAATMFQAGLMKDEMLIEIEVTARRQRKSGAGSDDAPLE
ncbi:endoribonuclease l-psp [Ophiostoma piceae UAMH 11346]|uniref:Endoribonuclease l-psp n=1 Tax=Ophiostoma piceae (strain UAMH 11346) TaxID=1262450 RepID=S3CT77_OPHP1|nr:endoribonuclease l-psp [Ophiostoma piceae UAMH 11346]